ncbi:hypothetical protein P8452_69355 [Trifolium repens]|nr:hypothetical protein P8452_69355 [Trifolium repens]
MLMIKSVLLNQMTKSSTKVPPTVATGSNDCGVWVAKWMIKCSFRNDYENITVVTTTKMKLALYLEKKRKTLIKV